MSFFGGDHRYSHFTSHVQSDHTEYNRLLMAGKHAEARIEKKRLDDLNRKHREKLKRLGFKERYFQYRNGDEAAKSAAKKKAEAFVKEWKRKARVPIIVTEGFFL